MDPKKTSTQWGRLIRSGNDELRSRLGIITGYSRVLQSGRAGPVSDLQRQWIEHMERELQRARATLDRLDTLALWSEARLPRREVEVIELGGVVREITSDLTARFPDVTWDQRIDSQDAHVRANRQDLRVLIETVIRCIWHGSVGSAPAIWVTEDGDQAIRGHRVVVSAPDQLERALDENNLQPFGDARAPHIHALNMAVAARVLAAQDVHVWCFRDMAGAVIALPQA